MTTPIYPRVRYAWLFVLLALVCKLYALDPERRITQYHTRLYQAEHGLPMTALKDVIQDNQGYIWISSQEGLARFDGVQFIIFRKSEYPNLVDDFIMDLELDHTGNIWMASQGNGIGMFDGNAFHIMNNKTGPVDNFVSRIISASDSSIWTASAKGVSQLKNGVFYNYRKVSDESQKPGLSSEAISGIVETAEGDILVSNMHFLHINRISNGNVDKVSSKQHTSCFYTLPSGDILLGGSTGSLEIYQDGLIKPFLPSQVPTPRAIVGIHMDSDENLWFLADGAGLYRYSSDGFKRLSFENRQVSSNSYFINVMEDSEKALWFTSDGGLYQLFDNSFVCWGINEGLKTDYIISIGEFPDGTFYAGSRASGLSIFNRDTTKHVTYAELSNNYEPNPFDLGSILRSKHDNLWIGSGKGLIKWSDESLVKRYIGIDGFYNPHILSVYEAADTSLVTGSTGGHVSVMKADSFISRPISSGIIGDVVSIIKRRNGEIWAGTRRDGLHVLSDENDMTGEAISLFQGQGVNALYEDVNNTVWIGSDGNGLYAYLDGNFININSQQGLSFDRLFSIVEDDFGYFWASGNRGIFRVALDQLYEFVRGETGTVVCESFDQRDGMRQSECNGRVQPCGFKDSNGRLWFTSIGGATSIHPAKMVKDSTALDLIIEEIRNPESNTSISQYPDSSITLHPINRSAELHYTALTFRNPLDVQFQYRIVDHSEEWIDLGTRRFLTLPALSPGSYMLELRGKKYKGEWNSIPVELGIVILPTLSENWWVRTVGLLLLIGSAIVFTRIYLSRRYDRLATENQLKLEREHSSRLSELDEMKSRFFANISHEFRTPLTLIQGPLEDLMQSEASSDRRHQFGIMLENCRRLLKMVGKLLDLARLESGSLKLNRKWVDVVSLIRVCLAAYESSSHRKNISLIFESPLDSLVAHIDPEKFEDVIHNLISNAMKFTDEGGEIRLQLESRPTGSDNAKHSHIKITVIDNGIGIEPEHHERIFERFYQVESGYAADHEHGTGIGLAMTREIVELHGGEISLVSAPQKGTRVMLTIPYDYSLAANAQSQFRTVDMLNSKETESDALPKDTTAIVSSRDTKPLTAQHKAAQQILVVEDNMQMRAYIRNCLSDFDIMEAADGVDGLAKARQHTPDLIISDVMMPDMDGHALTQLIREDTLLSHTPVILLTARAGEEAEIQGLSSGANIYIQKPFNKVKLNLTVANLILSQNRLRDHLCKTWPILPEEGSSLRISKRDQELLSHLKQIIESNMNNESFGVTELVAEVGYTHAPQPQTQQSDGYKLLESYS